MCEPIGEILTVQRDQDDVTRPSVRELGVPALDPIDRDLSSVLAHSDGNPKSALAPKLLRGLDLRSCRIGGGVASHAMMLAAANRFA